MVYLKRWTSFFETFPVRPNRSIEFWTEISGNFVWMDRADLMLALHEINANINNLRSFSRVNFLKRLFPRCFYYFGYASDILLFKRSICFIGAKIRHNQWNYEEPSNWPFVRLGKVRGGGGGTWVYVCWVCAAGLSKRSSLWMKLTRVFLFYITAPAPNVENEDAPQNHLETA